jgi:hypothetical protein
MLRILYTLLMVGLIGGTAWAASGYEPDNKKAGSGAVGFVILTALQRSAAT